MARRRIKLECPVELKKVDQSNRARASSQRANRFARFAVGDAVRVVQFHSRTAKVDAVVLEFRESSVYGNQVKVEYAGGVRWLTTERVTAGG